MSVTYGFYNSLNHDRKYDARQLGALFDGLITDGVYRSIGGAFAVTANSGMVVNVAPGRAWFNGTWTLNDAIMTITLPSSHPVYSKIVAVVIQVDKTSRVNTITYKEGVAGSSPTPPELEKTENRFEYPLAYITVKPGTTGISPGDIDICIGTTECPFVTGVVQGVSADDLIKNWKDEFEILFSQLKDSVSQVASGTVVDRSVTYEKLAANAVYYKFQNVTVPAELWEDGAADSEGNWPYYANVSLRNVTETCFPMVVFNPIDQEKYDFAPVCTAYDGGVRLYADTKPDRKSVV